MDETSIKARKHMEAQVLTRAQQDHTFRQQLAQDPKGVIARELGVTLPDSIQVEVLEESPSEVYLVLPQAPARTGTQLSDAELEGVAGGWSVDNSYECMTRTTDELCT